MLMFISFDRLVNRTPKEDSENQINGFKHEGFSLSTSNTFEVIKKRGMKI